MPLVKNINERELHSSTMASAIKSSCVYISMDGLLNKATHVLGSDWVVSKMFERINDYEYCFQEDKNSPIVYVYPHFHLDFSTILEKHTVRIIDVILEFYSDIFKYSNCPIDHIYIDEKTMLLPTRFGLLKDAVSQICINAQDPKNVTTFMRWDGNTDIGRVK